MDINTLYVVVSLLVALSIASERLVAIIKGLVPFLNQQNADPKKEGYRTAILQALAVVCGIVTTLLARPLIPSIIPGLNNLPGLLALGFLASGGSGFWNSVQAYLNQVKDIKKLEANVKKVQAAAAQVPH
jgi:hypothetical protein